MLISITLKGPNAKLLPGQLQLAPDAVHSSEYAFGRAIAFFSVLEAEVAEACLLLEVAADRLEQEVSFTGAGHPLRKHVHARAYTSSAFISLAIGKAFEKAIAAADKTKFDMEILVAAVETELDPSGLQAWWRPLGWQLKVDQRLRDEQFPEWGNSRCVDLRLRGSQTIAMALQQLQVMLCALDRDHLNWIGEPETQPILQSAHEILKGHPHQTAIQRAIETYPAVQHRTKMGQLFEEDEQADTPLLPPRTHDAAKALALAQHCQQWLVDARFQKALYLMAEDAESPLLLAAEPDVAKVVITHLDVAPLQRIAHHVNSSPIAVEFKRKMAVVHSSPLVKNTFFLGNDLVIVQNVQNTLPEWHWDAVASMVFSFLKPSRIVWIGSEHGALENWASQLGKVFSYSVQVATTPEEFQGVQVAIFDATETH